MSETAKISDRALSGEGLSSKEVRALLLSRDEALWREVFEAARRLTRERFEKRLQVFAPLYFSNICVNDCAYCGFKRSNRGTEKRRLTPADFVREAQCLKDQGHGSLLMVAAEHPVFSGALRIAGYLFELQRAGLSFDIGLEVGPLTQYEYVDLASMGVNRLVLYQETYDRALYARLHEGPKADYDNRYETPGRALAAGIKSVGIGILLGLHDWREDVPALVKHARELHTDLSLWPATVSLPRLRPAAGNDALLESPNLADDETFLKIIALLKVALPETGVVLTTRESADLRDRILKEEIGITHISAGVSTETGGYSDKTESSNPEQFHITDTRPLEQVVETVRGMGYEVCGLA